MSFERHRQDWEHLAEIDPLWAVLTVPGRKGGRWDVDEFFATGEAEIGHVISITETLGRLGAPRTGARLRLRCRPPHAGARRAIRVGARHRHLRRR